MNKRLTGLAAAAIWLVSTPGTAQMAEPMPGAPVELAPEMAAPPPPPAEPLTPERNRPHVFVTGLYARPDEDRNTKNYGSGGQVGFGLPLSANGNWWIEGRFDYTAFETGAGRGTDFYQSTIGADLQYAFGNRERLTPFVLAGLGYAYNDVVPDRDDDGGLEAELGVGLVGRVGSLRWLRARADARAVYDTFRDDQLDLRVHAGLEIALGQTAPRVVERRVEVPVPVPGPERIVTRVVTPEPDRDEDGDTVVDRLDRCPNTPRGAEVDARGCIVKNQKIVLLRDVSFDFDSSRLQLNGQRLLDAFVLFLNSQPELRGVIVGHTDNRGSDAYNQRLSERRANAAMQYLVGKGIAASRLTAKGMGEKEPIASNNTDLGRETNRRVEFEVIAPPGTPPPAATPDAPTTFFRPESAR